MVYRSVNTEFSRWNNSSFVFLGGGLNGYDDAIPREVSTLHWMNRIINLVHEHAPKAKFIFVADPQDLVNGFERVLGTAE